MHIRIDPLDKLVSEYVRKRSRGFCERCGKYYGWKHLQACHFHGRSSRSVRYDEDNIVALDFGCHVFLDSRPLEKTDFFKKRLGENGFNLLNARTRESGRYLDKAAIEIYYQEKIKLLERDNEL